MKTIIVNDARKSANVGPTFVLRLLLLKRGGPPEVEVGEGVGSGRA